jgi:hypothetical protein
VAFPFSGPGQIDYLLWVFVEDEVYFSLMCVTLNIMEDGM